MELRDAREAAAAPQASAPPSRRARESRRASFLESMTPHHIAEKLAHLPEKFRHFSSSISSTVSTSDKSISVDARGAVSSPENAPGDESRPIEHKEISDLARDLAIARPVVSRPKADKRFKH